MGSFLWFFAAMWVNKFTNPIYSQLVKRGTHNGMKSTGEERAEILEFVPEKFFKLVLVRPKYARVEQSENYPEKSQKTLVIGNLPSREIEKSLPEDRLLAAILVHKYIDHLPL